MIILPAIDIKDGNCVRLFQGDFSTTETVAENPLTTALSFANSGAQWIHMVDLDGALQGTRQNAAIFIEVAKSTTLHVEVGGGIRTMDDVEFYLTNGIARVILGSVAVKNPSFVAQATARYGAQIAVGIDAKNGYVSSEGWLEDSQIHYIELAQRMEAMGVKNIIYTDISKDGTLAGPNTAQLDALAYAVSCDITASGGIATIDDITQLRDSKLYGAICGKSIYKGTLSLEEAIALCQ